MEKLRIGILLSAEVNMEATVNIETTLGEKESEGLVKLREFLATSDLETANEEGCTVNYRLKNLRDGFYFGTYDPKTEVSSLEVERGDKVQDKIVFGEIASEDSRMAVIWCGSKPLELDGQSSEEAKARYVSGRINKMLFIVENAPRFRRMTGARNQVAAKLGNLVGRL